MYLKLLNWSKAFWNWAKHFYCSALWYCKKFCPFFVDNAIQKRTRLLGHAVPEKEIILLVIVLYVRQGWRHLIQRETSCTVCPGSSDPFDIVSYYIKWVTTSWTHGNFLLGQKLSPSHSFQFFIFNYKFFLIGIGKSDEI